MTVLSGVDACIEIVKKELSLDTHHDFLFLCVPQQFAYGINSRTLFSSTYSTQRGELLITFCNGNSAQNSSVGNQYGSEKITNFWLINMTALNKCWCLH